MTDFTSHDHDPGPRWWLRLDDGEHLAVDDPPVTPVDPRNDPGSVTLRLPAWRAYDLSRVLDAYTRMVALVSDAAEVSGTEARLASALRAASQTAPYPAAAGSERGPVRASMSARLRAMAVVQAEKPWLSYTAVLGVIDAAARWIEEQENDLAAGLLEAAAGEEPGRLAWEILQGVGSAPAGTDG